MIRQDYNRIDAKRRNVDHRKKQFAEAAYKETQYPSRLNYYSTPPTADITLEQFEQWAVDRLRSTHQPLSFTADPNPSARGTPFFPVPPANHLCSAQNDSPRRAGSMLVPEPHAGRDGGAHEAAPGEVPAARL